MILLLAEIYIYSHDGIGEIKQATLNYEPQSQVSKCLFENATRQGLFSLPHSLPRGHHTPNLGSMSGRNETPGKNMTAWIQPRHLLCTDWEKREKQCIWYVYVYSHYVYDMCM